MEDASWKGELAEEAGRSRRGRWRWTSRKTPKEAGRWRVWPSSEVTFAVALGGKEQSRAPAGGHAGLVAGSGSSSGLKTSIFFLCSRK